MIDVSTHIRRLPSSHQVRGRWMMVTGQPIPFGAIARPTVAIRPAGANDGNRRDGKPVLPNPLTYIAILTL